ncbi:MAG: MinD/ParA family protein [Cyanobacteria bacterium J06641_5]
MTKIVSVHSYRGGTGKSNISANLAATMALRGKRVGIIDTDIQSPGINVLFGLGNEEIANSTLNDYLWGRCRIEEVAYDVSHIVRGSTGGRLYLVPSSMRSEKIAAVLSEGYDVELLQDGLYDLSRRLDLDYVFIDTHPGLNEETLLSIGVSDTLIVILRPDQQDFLGTAVILEVARSLEVPKILLVVNKALTDVDFTALRESVEVNYKQPVAGILPLSIDMVRLGSEDLFCLRYREHELTAEFNRIVDCIP